MDGSPLGIAQAREVVLAACRPLGTEEVPVTDALGRVLAEPVIAAADVPPFASSAMDGYAVLAGPAGRVVRVVGESRAGTPAERGPGEGEAVAISTGAVVPPGAEAVVPLEVTERDGDRVTLTAPARPGDHVRGAGEDLRAGGTVLEPGRRLGPAEVGVAIGAGRASLRCARRPRVAVLCTGDELRAPGEPLGAGQIHNTNAYTLAALALESGAELAAPPGQVRDELGATRDALGSALDRADVLVVSGGVSVGPHDHVKGALAELGVQERFWRVALRPGRPTWFGVRGDRLVFGLPGNPVSAMVTFLLFARPALAALQGASTAVPVRLATMTEAIPRNAGRDEAVRVALRERDGVLQATPTGPQGSHQLTSMLGADGLVIVERGEGELPAGAPVRVEIR
ncbi:MAG TPA: gephyrin-like molybdotransferase Glp [Solirubrobacteraceae bacterium]|jgi:molybdopterin molybdotransferase|nr:gephyrin-like molybdotransferase Glp [Solirubrobacteraceae bacterium]